MKKMIATLHLVIFFGLFTQATAAHLTVGSATATVGETIQIPLTVDDPYSLAGAAFTLVYSQALTIRVESDFFDTFYNQFDALPTTDAPTETESGYQFLLLDELGNPVLDAENNPSYIDIPVVIDGQQYFQPLLTNLKKNNRNHLLVAAARCSPAESAAEAVLFTLNVSLNHGEPAGVYDIDIIPTTLDNPDAGYDPAGETIDLLTGMDLDRPSAEAFTTLLGANNYGTAVTQGQVVFQEGMPVKTTVVMNKTSSSHTITAGSNTLVYGTAQFNQITIASGARAELINFPEQSAILIQSHSHLFNVFRSGTVVTFSGSDGTILKIPATTSVQTVLFNDKTLTLGIHNNQVMLDDQTIGLESSPVTGSNG